MYIDNDLYRKMPIVRPMNGSKRKINLIRKPMQNKVNNVTA